MAKRRKQPKPMQKMNLNSIQDVIQKLDYLDGECGVILTELTDAELAVVKEACEQMIGLNETEQDAVKREFAKGRFD